MNPQAVSSVETRHLEYNARLSEWTTVWDVVEGEKQVKSKGILYLPKPEPDMTDAEYNAYRTRAIFYGVTGRTLEGHVGHVFSKLPVINLTPRLQLIQDNVDGDGTNLDQLAKEALARVLSVGRCGLLVDYPRRPEGAEEATIADLDSGNVRPTIRAYTTFDITNWKTESFGAVNKLTMVTLRETYLKENQNEFGTEQEVQYRVLRLNRTEGENGVEDGVTWEIWRKGAKNGNESYQIAEGPISITDGRGQPWDEIPFYFIGWETNGPTVNSVPLYDLAAINLGHYRNSAEVEDSVFLLGNPQLVINGLTKEWITEIWKNKGVKFGVRSAITLPKDASADLIQAQPNTLAKEAMEHKEKQMKALGAALVEEKSVQRTATEAGQDEAVKVSVLSSSADNVSAAMTKALVAAARYVGEQPQRVKDPQTGKEHDTISYILNTDFDLNAMDAQERAQLLAEYHAKAISYTELREGLKAAGVAFLDDKVAADEIENDPLREDISDMVPGGGNPAQNQ